MSNSPTSYPFLDALNGTLTDPVALAGEMPANLRDAADVYSKDEITQAPSSSAGLDTALGVSSGALSQAPQTKEFRLLDYVYALSKPTAAAIGTFDYASQNETLLLQACRAAGDDALTFMKGGANRSARIILPTGGISIKDEFFSDSFQSGWWSQASLLKGKYLVVEGSSVGTSVIKISSNYVGSSRNSTVGNQRSYGPWSGQASPSILFAMLADARNGAPASLSLKNFKVLGTGADGVDPIGIWAANELDADSGHIHFQGLRNHGQVINGSYNSVHIREHFENCGLQPVESGAIMGYAPGFPPPYVVFDYTVSGSTVTIVAKAGAAYDGYNIGDTVPYFYNRHVGLTFYLFGSHVVSGAAQTGKLSIATVGGDASPNATMTLPSGVSGPASRTGAAGSFAPIRFTSTATSDTVTLSAPMKFGTGAANMVGHVVALVKAGGSGNVSDTGRYQKPDVLVSRVKAVSNGSDANGYSTIQLMEPCRLSTTDFILTGQGFMSCLEETYSKLLGSSAFSLNDTDFINSRWEYSGGFGNSPHTGSCQFMLGDTTGTSAFVSCKAHGANPNLGNFGADAQFVLDNNQGFDWIGSNFTHSCMTGQQVRLMGRYQIGRFTAFEIGSWQLPTDFVAIYGDPPSSYDTWDVHLSGAVNAAVNINFPTAKRLIRNGSSVFNAYDMSRFIKDGTNTVYNPNFSWLDSTADLNNVKLSGLYGWWSSIPTNAPVNGANGFLWVSADPQAGNVAQVIVDIDNKTTWTRHNLSGTWGSWQTDAVRNATATQIASKTHDMNVNNKRLGALTFDTTNNRLMVSSGANDVSPWYVADGSASVTPS